MDEREIRHRASQAQVLLDSEAFKAAMDFVTNDAKNALVECEPEDLRRLQAAAKACEHIETMLRGWVLAASTLPQPTDPTSTTDPGVA